MLGISLGNGAAAQAGQTAAATASIMGLGVAVASGAAGLIVGMFLGMAIRDKR
jgi:hypothetical protein